MKKIVKFLAVAVLVLLVFSSCKDEKKEYKFLKVSEYSLSKVSDTSLVSFLSRENNIKLSIEYTLSEDVALKKLKDKEVDFLIIPNNARYSRSDFRTVVPLLPRVLMILTNKKLSFNDIKDVFEKGVVYFEDRSRLDSIFFEKLYYNFNIDERKIDSHLVEELSPEKESDSLEVYVGLTHFNNTEVRNLSDRGWYFYSMDDINMFGKGSRIEGFTMMNTDSYPFVLPMSIFRGKPLRSILTVAINDILITRKDVDHNLVYNLTKTIIENKSELIQMDQTYNLLKFDYDAQVLTFPIHRGARDYLNRNEPPVWYKYVKMVWPLISISVVLFGIFASFRQRLKRRKKQNIEMYYNSLLDIREKSDSTTDPEEYTALLKEMKKLRAQAIKSLAKKRLDPGESFNIFLALYNETKGELIERIREERAREKEQTDKKA